MIVNSIQQELIHLLEVIPNTSRSELDECVKQIDEKILNLIHNNPIGSLSSDLINIINNSMKDRKIKMRTQIPNWSIYRKIDRYIRQENGPEKKIMFEKLKIQIRELNNNIMQRSRILDKNLIKLIYTPSG